MSIRVACCGVGALLLCLVLSGVAEARKWTSRDGMFSVEAELADFQSGNVLLRRADDKIIKVPLDKLSLADALYVQQALEALGRDLKAEQAGGKSPTPAPMATPLPAPSATTPSEPVTPAVAEKPTGKWAPNGPPLTKPTAGDWQVHADPTAEPLVLAADQALSIPVRRGHNKPIILYSSAPTRFVMIGEEDRQAPKKVFDLQQGTVVGQIRAEMSNPQCMALSPDGKHLAYYSYDSRGKVQIWSFATGKQVQTIALEKEYSTPQLLCFAGNNHLLVLVPGEKNVQVWDVHEAKEAAAIPSNGLVQEGQVAVSPGGHYVAVAGQRVIDIYDARNGEFAGELEYQEPNKFERIDALAFSHDGSELAALFGSTRSPTLMCWDLKTGKSLVRHQIKSIPFVGGTYIGPKLEWFADKSGWLLLGVAYVDRQAGGPVYVDTERRGIYVTRTRFVDAERMLTGVGADDELSLKLVPIPRDKLAAGAKAVAKGGAPEDAQLPEMISTDLANAPVMMPQATAGWSYEPSVVAFPKTVDWKTPFALRNSLYRDVQFARPDAGRVVLGFSDTELAKHKPIEVRHSNVYETYDLATRRLVARFEVPFGMVIKGICPKGEKGIFALDTKYERLDLFDLASSKHLLAFRPYHTQGDSEIHRTVNWACLCNDELLLTMSQAKCLVAWRLPTCEPLFKMPLGPTGSATIDTARKTLAVADGSQVYLIDAATAETKGILATPTDRTAAGFINGLAFRDDGQALAANYYGQHGVTVVEWELAKGTVKSQVALKVPAQAITWVGPRHVLLHSTASRPEALYSSPTDSDLKRVHQCSLVDLDGSNVVWTYQHGIGSPLRASPGDKHWYTSSADYGRPASLVALTLPDADAAKWISSVAAEGPVVGRGGSVAIKVEIEGNFPASTDQKVSRAIQLRDDVVQKLTSALERQKVSVADKAEATMHVTLRERSHSAAVEVRSRYGLRPGAVLRVTLTAIEIQATLRDKAGEVLWQTQHLHGLDELKDLDLERRPVEMTPENYLRQEQWRSAVQWVQQLDVPLPLYRGAVQLGMGESLLTPTGPRATRTPTPPPPAKKDKQT